MPYKRVIPEHERGPGDPKFFYNLTQSVGKGGVNRKLDTMLVQYMLKKIFTVPAPDIRKPKGTMIVDGICGPITKSWIEHFQGLVNCSELHQFGNVVVDGRVDRVGNTPYDKKSGTHYTLLILNYVIFQNFKDIYEYPFSSIDIPADLIEAMMSTNPV